MTTAPSHSYDYLRRKPLRTPSERHSNATVSSYSTTTTRDTAVTEPPAYSKKLVVKYVPTVFENYITHTPHPPSGKMVELALWDTAGQEEYDRLRPLSYPETDIIFVCFAIDCPNSLENVMDKWYPEVLHFCPTTPLLLLGLKSDLRNKKNCIELLKTQGLTPVTPDQGRAVAKKMGAVYMECSSKERHGVDDIFDLAVTMAVADEYKTAEQRSAHAAQRTSHEAMAMAAKKKKKRSGCKVL
ncbi:RHO4 protein [Pleosporales sp. CAS-2024a]